MSGLIALIVPAIIIIAVALVIVWAAERFSPDPLITKIVQLVVFACVLIWFVTKLLPMVH
jgi:hypothetical protein